MIYLLYIILISIYSGAWAQTAQQTAGTDTFTGPVISRVDQVRPVQYATARFTPCALYCSTSTTIPGTASKAVLVKDSPQTKNNIAFTGKLLAQRGQISLTLRGHAYINQPAGQQLFPNNNDLATAFDNITSQLQQTGTVRQSVGNTNILLSYFVPLFRKLQFMALNDLYIYLTSIYTTFNLSQQRVLADYINSQATTDHNKKAIIIGHLLNLIQSQMYFICTHHLPLISKQHFALKAGNLAITHDYTSDPLFLIRDFNQPLPGLDTNLAESNAFIKTTKATQQSYIQMLGQILNFFALYTGYIDKQINILEGGNAFVPIAARIQNLLDNNLFNIESQKINSGDASQKVASLRSLKERIKPLNPPFFYYDDQTLRALKLIPQLARELSPTSTSIGWPKQLIEKAINRTTAVDSQGNSLHYSIAYFQDANNNIVNDLSQATKLFINVPTPRGPYAQEVKRQPDWFNSPAGIIRILKACLGDYTQALAMGIFQPCLENIFCQATGKSCPTPALEICRQEFEQINAVHAQYAKDLQKAKKAAITTVAQEQPPDLTAYAQSQP